MALHGLYRCLLNPSGVSYYTSNTVEVESQNAYVNIFRFLSTLTGSGEVSRIAYNIGHVNSGALGNGLGFWGEANQCGGNAWSVWRFNSGSNRTFDFYILFQHAGGNSSATLGNTSASYGFIPTADSTYSSTYRGMLAYQIAASVHPTTGISSNPWNGTTNNDGTDAKGTPTWVTGSVGHDLFVVPAHNNARPNKDSLAAIFYRSNSSSGFRYVMNIHSWNDTDLDGMFFSFFKDMQLSNNQYSAVGQDYLEHACYIGTYKRRDALTGSVKAPIVGAGGESPYNRPFQNSSNATLIRSGAAGIALSSSNVETLYAFPLGGIAGITSIINPMGIDPSFLNKKETHEIFLVATGSTGGSAGTGSIGMVGSLGDNVRIAWSTLPLACNQTHMMAALENFGGVGSVIVLPWSGSNSFWTATSQSGSILF